MWIYRRSTAPILSQDRRRRLRWRLAKSGSWAKNNKSSSGRRAAAWISFKITDLGRRPVPPTGPVRMYRRMRARTSATGAGVAGKLGSLPSPRRIAAPHNPPSFLPAPPACQSRVTSPPGWIPGLVPFRIPDDIPDDIPDGAPDDAPDAVLSYIGTKI